MDITLKRTIFRLTGRDILLDVVDDVEQLITDLSDGDKVPCWAEVWPAAKTMARYIWDHLGMEGKTVLELGSGLGLPGTVCAVKGAAVTFSDYNREAVSHSLHNAELNGATAAGHVGDWRLFDLVGVYDWIIGSDVYYDPKLNPFVLQIFKKHLNPAGSLLISHQRRQHTYDFVARVKKELLLDEIRVDTTESDEESVYRQFSVSIHVLKKSAQNMA